MAKPIGIGEAQSRSFFPAGDIDRVTFVAKANVAYSLSTTDLAPGVDTVITVQVGDRTYRNDDRAPGEAASEVQFMTPVDQRVYANVTNKGLYGANATYQLVLGLVAGDEYEPDDNNPKPISPLEEQIHSFYPEGDVDRMLLNVKSGVEYVIQTYDLAPGVDTVIYVTFEGQTFQSDDIDRDEIASQVRFTAWKDGQALITVMNREQYGIDRTYKIVVLPQGAAPTATPTPDLRDPYEPDEADPPLLAVGEIQRRNFYPEGDVDYVRILYKAGRIYRLSTSNLAPGVDTMLEIVVEGIAYRNEDVSMVDLSSAIEFSPTRDGEAVAIIRNRGRYGPGQTYDLTLSLVAPVTPTPTLTPTPDLRDAYEPDEVSPPPLAVDQVQTRNFFPSGDVDYARLTLEAGWVYFVRATGLVADARPYLSAVVDGTLREAYPVGASAELKVVPAVNQTAILEVRNFAGLYGADKQYRLTLVRMAPTPTASGSWLGPHNALARGDALIKFPALGRPLAQAESGNPIRFVLLLRMK